MFTPDRQWVEAFAEAVHDTMRRCGSPTNCCVEAACVGTGVAREFGYLVEAVPVAVVVRAGRQATILPGPDGAGKRRSGFAGHLILHFPTAGLLVDATADQFHDPARGLHVPDPLTADVDRRDLAYGFVGALPTGTTIRYREMVGDVSWRALQAWAEPSTLAVRLAVRDLRQRLAGGQAMPAETSSGAAAVGLRWRPRSTGRSSTVARTGGR